jgi:hypothetical protein
VAGVPLLPHERRLLPWAPLLILLSSVAGLNLWVAYFGAIWTANLWGDLVFSAGTLLTVAVGIRASKATHSAVGALLAAAMTAVTYVVSYAFAEAGMDGATSFLGFAPYGWDSAGFVLSVGWPGLLANGIMVAVVASRAGHSARPRARGQQTAP